MNNIKYLHQIPIQQHTIPELGPDNLEQWILAIKCASDTLQINAQIEIINYGFCPIYIIDL